jgi:hypothetical protein
MMQLELKNHPVWKDLTEILENLDSDALVREHLNACGYRVCGYWDEQEQYYEEIALPENLRAELVGSSINVSHGERSLQLKFSLKVDRERESSLHEAETIGELVLIYNEALEFMDENWLLDVMSPFLKVRQVSI